MKILFLDIDGVLNNHKTIQMPMVLSDDGRHHCQFDPDCVHLLNYICAETGCFLVLSSTWRNGTEENFENTKKYIASQGVETPIIARTPQAFQIMTETGEFTGRWSKRGNEIDTYLSTRNDVDRFAIIDDDDDMEPHMDKLVKTEFDIGLQKCHMDPLLVLLGQK